MASRQQGALVQGVHLASCAAIASLLCACVSSGRAADTAQDDPQSPVALESRLEAAAQVAAASGGRCLARLDSARSLLDALAASPAFAILLPRGAARLDAVRYQMHRARAACVSNATQHDGELRAALAAARRAVAEYRDGLDYRAMVIMQFNVAVTLRTLGDSAASAAALRAAIQMDDEYGFDQDAQDNGQLLARWQGPQTLQPASALEVPGDAARSVSLRFAWTESDATVALQMSLARIAADQTVHLTASRTVQRHVRRTLDRWVVSYGQGPVVPGEMSGLGPTDLLRSLALPVAQGLLEMPEMQLSAQGDFQYLVQGRSFAYQLQLTALKLIRAHAGGHEPFDADIRDLATELAPESVSAKAEEDHTLMTAAWIGATLEQGEWYRTQAPLMMPGFPQLSLVQDLEFAYTQRVPCVKGAAQRSCVEIVVHATAPRREAAAALRKFMHLAARPQYWSATYLRIVVDPDTLTPYVRDTRLYWYLRCVTAAPCPGESALERTLWCATTPRPALVDGSADH